jgi:hypothetical protein
VKKKNPAIKKKIGRKFNPCPKFFYTDEETEQKIKKLSSLGLTFTDLIREALAEKLATKEVQSLLEQEKSNEEIVE